MESNRSAELRCWERLSPRCNNGKSWESRITEATKHGTALTFVFSRSSDSHLVGVKEQTSALAPSFLTVSLRIYSGSPPDNICRTAFASGRALTEHERSARLSRSKARRADGRESDSFSELRWTHGSLGRLWNLIGCCGDSLKYYQRG